MERVITDSPCHRALFSGRRALVRLTFDTEIHDVVTADGAVVDDDIPSPQSHSVPLDGNSD
jgi:hypothetical protein